MNEVIFACVRLPREQIPTNEEWIGQTDVGHIAQKIIIGAMRSAVESARLLQVDVSITPESNLQSDKTFKAKLMSANGV